MVFHTTLVTAVSLVVLLTFVRDSSQLCRRKECTCRNRPPQGVTAYCHFETRQRLTLESVDFSEELTWVELVGGKELRFGLSVFSKLSALRGVAIRNATKVLVQKHSFANLTSPFVMFEFSECGGLLLEEGSFGGQKGPVGAAVRSVGHLVLQRAAFSWLSDLTLEGVAKLELLDEAFLLDNPLDKIGEGPLTTITLEKVSIETIGRSTFHSSAKEIRIVNSNIKTIKTDAFDAIEIRGVVIENSTVHEIAAGAFNDRTLVVTLRLTNVHIQEIASGALPFGSSQLIIENSRINRIYKGAINVTVAEAIFSRNSFGVVHSKGVHLEKWNSLTLVGNEFKRLESEAFSAPVQPPLDKVGWFPECNLTGNIIYDFGPRAFDFSLTQDVNVNIDANLFVFKCHCDMSNTLKSVVTDTTVVYGSSLYETGSCSVDRRMAECYKIEQGFIGMVNFTETYCQEPIVCEEQHQRDAALPPVVPIITVTDIMHHDERERERLIMGSVVVIFAIGMLIVLLVSIIKWIKDYNYCGKARMIFMSAISPVFSTGTRGGGLTPTGSAHSISRVSVHEYAELQKKCRGSLQIPVEVVEDKATQTLHEEITQELLQSLREKLNDPADYKEARDMIEHLYDLIKVEDSCNRNETTSLNLEEFDKEYNNVYEVPRRKSEPTGGRRTVTRGTRAPSPDKLLPQAIYRKPPTMVVCEYLEPRDRALHVYSELAQPKAPVSDYMEPNDSTQHIYTELPNLPRIANRPLPSKPS